MLGLPIASVASVPYALPFGDQNSSLGDAKNEAIESEISLAIPRNSDKRAKPELISYQGISEQWINLMPRPFSQVYVDLTAITRPPFFGRSLTPTVRWSRPPRWLANTNVQSTRVPQYG
jgi:hypothetical protein